MPPERRLQFVQLQQRVEKEVRGLSGTVTSIVVRRNQRILAVCIYLDFSTETAAGCLSCHDAYAYALMCSMVLGLRWYIDRAGTGSV